MSRKLLILGGNYPHSGHSIRAANVVIFELLRALVSKGNGRVGYQLVQRASDPRPTEMELRGLEELTAVGVDVLSPLLLPPNLQSRPLWKRLLNSKRIDFYPESIHADLVFKAVEEFKPDVILVPWSEWVTGLCADFPLKKFAYYGNPDHKSRAFRMRFDRCHQIMGHSKIREIATLELLERRHLEVMSKYDLVGDVANNDAKYYSDNGHPNAFYIQNVWTDSFGSQWECLRNRAEAQSNVIQIASSIGQLEGTANRYGLEILGRDLAPLLKKQMRNIPYVLNVYGRGEPPLQLRHMLQLPEIRLKGFVDDIDAEILASQVFLCLNNASPFKVGHTRYLHAWSLGACVVAHQDSALSMPEMISNDNCLLGRDMQEIAEMIHAAVLDANLRRSIGRRGYETFTKFFLADAVADRIWEKIETIEPKASVL